jgi:hypothetical protein
MTMVSFPIKKTIESESEMEKYWKRRRKSEDDPLN